MTNRLLFKVGPPRPLWVRPKGGKIFFGVFFMGKIFFDPYFLGPPGPLLPPGGVPPTPPGWVPAGPPPPRVLKRSLMTNTTILVCRERILPATVAHNSGADLQLVPLRFTILPVMESPLTSPQLSEPDPEVTWRLQGLLTFLGQGARRQTPSRSPVSSRNIHNILIF